MCVTHHVHHYKIQLEKDDKDISPDELCMYVRNETVLHKRDAIDYNIELSYANNALTESLLVIHALIVQFEPAVVLVCLPMM